MSEIKNASNTESLNEMTFRQATVSDGVAVWQVVQQAGTLEVNTAYFYLIFCSDFANTCLVAEHNARIVGVLIGYQPPNEPDTAFCWQIGCVPDWQGKGLGKRMLSAWLALPANHTVKWLTATVAQDNEPSDRLFRGFAKQLNAACSIKPHFTQALLPTGHAPEPLYRIGPIHSAR